MQKGQVFKVYGRFSALTPNMFNILSTLITRDDIRATLFDMKPLKALGPNGLHVAFF